jgi:Pyruvate/2-oxoacid:ferredoxin oxidoreductase delta subunit
MGGQPRIVLAGLRPPPGPATLSGTDNSIGLVRETARSLGTACLTDRVARPRWHHRCEQCFACIHWCPVAAIQIRGRPTAKRGRYHHPNVSLEDIASQQRQAL